MISAIRRYRRANVPSTSGQPRELETMSTSERSSGLRSVLSLAPVYATFQRLVGATNARTVIAEQYLRLDSTERVLDIGCGVGDILDSLPEDIVYVGFDPSPKYIAAATAKYGHRATFTTASVGDEFPEPTFSVVMAIGVLHHLDDGDALALFETARSALAPGGRFVSVDPTFVDGQATTARMLVKADRGQRVRTPEELERLGRQVFADLDIDVRSDLLRIPYNHAILTASA